MFINDSMNPDLPKGNALSKRLSKKTVVFITLAILVSLSASVYILFFTGSAPKINQLFKPKAPTVTVKTETKNPFKKETQFVNPFDPVKSPFYALENKGTKK
ncbi:MAG: hypothetical protein UV61_C0003G0099 [Candidatus Gottesmanbacteria bacterium GW2011_GWB1_43_11]|uniref:Uncharacterized protein n=1 Tax=Candidatus Gottesmanbacteria bacterium GW2011_GWB1_43_11 TaxID=1618446 RepID=A0A0G1EW48_9BACT|nr:MAG: hypothetical protein UV04_C0029G0005 [Candidatus Gottesmanbacteria bacterium GW2011_GWA2_42_16]KKS80423.1 MAG: hypothetical protein UV55_C0039G0005 [Candidatus Gottesmanbacteria bacterium GW2011_GWC1_43_10]KKS87246.1 MAG: hypothetical protein UV61_C0003G0099 [Candidatus Gottesmanbacteria bacterium GW2011_GWB1_43_11]